MLNGATPTRDPVAGLVPTLTLTVFLEWLGSTAIIPMLPEYIRRLGGTDALAGMVMASFFAAGVLLQYPVGRLVDRVGRRPVLVAGLVTYGAASLSFLFPIVPWVAIVLRAFQGAGAGAASVAALSMVSAAVPAERRGRAFASVYGGQISGMAVGPLVGSVIGVDHMDLLFLGAGVLTLAACVPALRIVEPARTPATAAPVVRRGLGNLHLHRPAAGAVLAGAAIGVTTGIYDICWTLLLLSRHATGWEIGVSWTLFAVPFVLAAKPAGWLVDHLDRRVLVALGIGSSSLYCMAYPFIHAVPLLIVLGATEAMGWAVSMPAVQSLLSEGTDESEVGRVQGLFATVQTACTAVSAALAGAAFALAVWLPFVTASTLAIILLLSAQVVWRGVAGRAGGPSADAPGAETAREELVASAPGSAAPAVSAVPVGD